MKGFFLVLMLIALLVVGVLVMKNMGEQQSDTPGKMEATQKAERTAEDVQKKFDALQKKANKAGEAGESGEEKESDE